MSLSEVSVRSNSFSDNWYGARAVIKEELRAIGKALERIRISSQLEDELTEHLLAVHRQWCEACPPAAAGGHRGGGPLEKESQAAAAHTSKNPQKHVPTSTETTDIGLQMNVVDEEDDNNDDMGEPSVPLSMIWCQDEETPSDVTRTLQEASAEKVVSHSTTFIKVEALEDDQYPDMLLKLEKDHSDVDVDSSNMETTSHQRHDEEEPSQHTESDVANDATSALTCHVLSPDGVSDDQNSVGLDSNKRVQRTSRSDDGTTIQSSTLNCDVLSPEEVCDDQFSVGLDSNKRVQRTSRSDDGRNNTSSTLHCDALSLAGVSDDQFSVGLDSNKKVKKTSKSSGKMFSSVCSKSLSKESVGTFMMKHNREKPFKCDFCGYQCSTKETLNVHMRTHSGAYPCSSCDKSFSRKWDMEHHMMMAHFHSGEKCFPCDYCSYSSNSKTHLQIHMRIHTREKPFKCDRCTYRSTTKQNLKIHMRVHTGERPHECSLCGKRFTQMSNLKSHMMIHTGQKPHQCSVCGKRFTKMGGLKRHMKTH